METLNSLMGMDAYSREVLARSLGHNVRVFFEGWESTLPRLLDSGWDLQTERNLHHGNIGAIFTNNTLKLCGFINDIDFMTRSNTHMIKISRVVCLQGSFIQATSRPDYVVQRVDLGTHIMHEYMNMQNFALIDILQPVDIDKLLIAKEDEKTVDDLLGHILKKQTNLRNEIAERRVRETVIERPSAQIIKLFAA